MLDHTIDTTIRIDAHPTRVWDVLTDFPAYPHWNPFIRSIEGRLVIGETLVVRIAPPGRRAMTFRPKVIALAQGRELRWLGHLLVPYLFDGAHGFQVLPEGEGTLFRQGEAFAGLLVPFLGMALFQSTEAGFLAMNEALKARAEGEGGSL